jgi:tetratricopeptide (TPR) repeat protein
VPFTPSGKRLPTTGQPRLISLPGGSFEKAVASYDKALELNGSNDHLWISRGVAPANLGRFDQAIEASSRPFF